MSKEKIIDYVMNSPENTNESVLKSLLDKEEPKIATITLHVTNNSSAHIYINGVDYFDDLNIVRARNGLPVSKNGGVRDIPILAAISQVTGSLQTSATIMKTSKNSDITLQSEYASLIHVDDQTYYIIQTQANPPEVIDCVFS